MRLPAPFRVGAEHYRLVLRLSRREVEARYRGSIFGLLWVILLPFLTVAVYAFVFSVIFRQRWEIEPGSNGNYVLFLYSGVLVFSLFAECMNRAPTLLLENVSYIKKVVFPLEILAWAALITAGFNLVVGVAVMMVLYLALVGIPPWTIVLLPIVVGPLAMATLGLTWLLAALGIFLRDLRHIIGVVTSLLLFLSPVFYPIRVVPEPFQQILRLNPTTEVLEATRDLLFVGKVPGLTTLAFGYALSIAVACAGLWCFNRLRRGFADVV